MSMTVIETFFANEENIIVEEKNEGRGRKYRRNRFFQKERRQTFAGLKHCRYEYNEEQDEFVVKYYKKYCPNCKKAKRAANKTIRHAKVVGDYGAYKKHYEPWNICE